jgi:hypothetical protein
LHRAADDTRKLMNETVGISESIKYKDHHLEPMDEQDMRSHGSVLAILEEFAGLKAYPDHEALLKRVAPVYFSWMTQEALGKGIPLYKYLMQRTGLAEDMFAESMKRCIAHDKSVFVQLTADYDKRMKATFMREQHQAMKVVPPEVEVISRYRVSLENSLARAIKALRQEQDRRSTLIEGEAEVVG